jgi:drug/metabolite transporter (DMT)-like permease
MEAIRVSPLSLTLPYLAFTPTFMIITGLIFLGESPGLWGGVGIIVTCVGSYILNLNPESKSLLSPLKAVFKENGSWIMLLVAFLFSITAVMGKKAILHSSPAFFTFSFFIIHNVVILIFMSAIGKVKASDLVQHLSKGAIAGSLFFLHILCHGYAISMVNAAYMVSIKRMSILIGMVYGRIYLEEKQNVTMFVGALLMISGAGIIMIIGSSR